WLALRELDVGEKIPWLGKLFMEF
ncbi:MAG: hypothetical protein PWQ32_1491, partial [Thermococcaceae archaeon]|nr:hypothetical protein [Thermococcaceae archaeon]